LAVSTAERDDRLNVFRGTAYPAAPANHYISLHSADPGLTGANELSGGAYARVAIAPGTGTWSAPATNGSVREISNSGAITFPTATADWTTATHFGVWKASSAGTFVRGAALTASKTVQNGDTASFAAGALVLQEQ
jgi:hypothetical protein